MYEHPAGSAVRWKYLPLGDSLNFQRRFSPAFGSKAFPQLWDFGVELYSGRFDVAYLADNGLGRPAWSRAEANLRVSSMNPPSGLADEDVRGIVRLLSDIVILDSSLAGKKAALMSGLQKLIGADGWLWSVTRVDVDTRTPISVGLMHGGLSDEQLTGWLEASQSNCPPPEDGPMFELTRTRSHFTRTRQQVVSDEDWYKHPAVVRHRLRLGIEHFLYSVYPIDEADELYSAIGLFRFLGREKFSERELRIAHIVLSEVAWLHTAELPGDRGQKVPMLTPRQRVVLIMLLEAHDKDEIARLLHISPHTAKDHIKAIYEHFNVSSQLELIRRFRYGDAGHALEAAVEI